MYRSEEVALDNANDNCQLIHGDCLTEMARLEAGSVDMVLCDLPYGTTACSWDAVIPFEPLWREYRRLVKSNGAIVLTSSQPFTTALIHSNLSDFKYCWVWDKAKASSGLHAKVQPLRVHEDILIFGRGRVLYNPQMEEAARRINKPVAIANGEAFGGNVVVRGHDNGGFHYPKSILRISNADQRNRVHPTQKPVALCEYMIRTYTNPGDTVLDNTMGSGTTGVAAVNTGRNFIGIERDENYFAIARKRIGEALPVGQPVPATPTPANDNTQADLFGATA